MNSNDKTEALRSEFEEFSYIVSHDLKAPIRAISNLSAWIEEDLGEEIPGEVKHNMHLLRSRANRLERMVDSLTQHYRVSTQELDVLPTQVAELAREVVNDLSDPESVVLQLPQPLPQFVTYRQKLRSVLQHIIGNAAQHSGKRITEVVLQAKEHAICYEFSVQDNGAGVPAEALDKIFKMFYTVAPKDTVDTDGAGLALTKKIVQFVGGHITANSNELNGLTVIFTWPKYIPSTENRR